MLLHHISGEKGVHWTSWVSAAGLGNTRDGFIGPDGWTITVSTHRSVRSVRLALNCLPLLIHRKMPGAEVRM